ncbi:MAG: ATP-binding protein [Oscillospiraceae bacterium]|nr:ATP-binding protein [Oscillospiraceae bacterium]
MSIDFSMSGKPFSSQRELLDRFSEILDLHIYYLYKYHAWVSPNNTLQSIMGVVVTREEFESSLENVTETTAYSSLTDEEAKELDMVRDHFIGRYNATAESGAGFPLVRLGASFGLDFFQYAVVLTLLCCELNRKYEKMFAFLQDDITKKTLSTDIAIQLWAEVGDNIYDYYSAFSDSSVLTKYLCTTEEGTLSSRLIRLSKAVADFVTGTAPGSEYEFFRRGTELSPMCVDRDIMERAAGSVLHSQEGSTLVAYIVGKRGSGRRFLVKHCAQTVGESVLFIGAASLLNSDGITAALCRAVTIARLEGCAVCITDFECFLNEDITDKLHEFSTALNGAAEQLGTHLYITSEKKWNGARLGEKLTKLDFEIPETDEAKRLTLWEHYLRDRSFDGEITAQELAAKFRFTAGQIKAAADRAASLAEISGSGSVSAELMHQSCYDQVVVGLDALATPIKPAYDWEDLVLPESEIKLLKEACTHIRYRHTVYNEWGFGKKAAYGRGLSLLFSGPPGTGKTMAAQVITNQLHMQLYKVQLSQIVSKYIGETEKNLRKVFTEAKNANCVLFFDETDALFGKRSEVKDSHDRHANIETAYLLQQMEEYDGVVLMATNLLQNIDEAFMRRISFVISFPFPDPATRALLWKKMLDTSAPLSEDVDFGFLAENFKIAGGNIKNCVVHAAFLAAAEGAPIGMRHLLRAVVKEQRKNNIIVLKDDLRQYADLVFGAQ